MRPAQLVAIWVPVALVTAGAMEPWAALLHGQFWHRWLWPIHSSHHHLKGQEDRSRAGRFELNDALSFLHAPIAVALILYGCVGAPGVMREVLFGIGLGMSLFGVAYILIHDGVVHGRLPVGALLRLSYFRRVRDAHLLHHSRSGPPYGLFASPFLLR